MQYHPIASVLKLCVIHSMGLNPKTHIRNYEKNSAERISHFTHLLNNVKTNLKVLK